MTSWLRQYCIYVSDLDAAIAFWETLGLECTSRTVITDDITEAVLENPEKGGWIQLAHNKQHTGPIDMGTAMWKLYLYTDDCPRGVRQGRRRRIRIGDTTGDARPLAGDDGLRLRSRRVPGRAAGTSRAGNRAERRRNHTGSDAVARPGTAFVERTSWLRQTAR